MPAPPAAWMRAVLAVWLTITAGLALSASSADADECQESGWRWLALAALVAAVGALLAVTAPLVWPRKFSQVAALPTWGFVALGTLALAVVVAAVGAGTASFQGKKDDGSQDTHHDALAAIYMGWMSVPAAVFTLLYEANAARR